MRLSIIPWKDGKDMLENLSDMLSLIVTAIFVIVGIILFFIVSDRHYADSMKKREERYDSFLEGMDDGYDDNNDGPFFG